MTINMGLEFFNNVYANEKLEKPCREFGYILSLATREQRFNGSRSLFNSSCISIDNNESKNETK